MSDQAADHRIDRSPRAPQSRDDRRRHWPRAIRGLLVVAAAFSICLGYATHGWRKAQQYPLRPYELSAKWIRSPGPASYAGYLRRHLRVTQSVKNAWLAISACDGFEVTVNGNPVCRQFLWRPTRPFQNGLTEKGQRVTTLYPSLALNFPREYQWSGHDSYRMPVFVDIRPELRHGDNVICLSIESRQAPAKVAIEGAVTLLSGETISLASDESWKAEPVPPGIQLFDWTSPQYRDYQWRQAVATTPPNGTTWRRLSPNIYRSPFAGRWLRHPQAGAQEAVWYRKKWVLPDRPDQAWIRLATNRYFNLFVNGTHVAAAYAFASDIDSGHWIIERQRALDLPSSPTILDPDELDSPFIGDAFERPATGDPTAYAYHAPRVRRQDYDPQGALGTILDLSGGYDLKELRADKGRERYRPYLSIDAVKPRSLHVDRSQGGFMAYDIARLMRAGENEIIVRVSEPVTVGSFSWTATLAIDGEASVGGQLYSPLGSDAEWTCARGATVGTGTHWQDAVAGALANQASSALPRLQYRGHVRSSSVSANRMTRDIAHAVILTWTASFVFLAVGYLVSTNPNREQTVLDLSKMLYALLSAATIVLGTAALVKSCWAERYELTWFQLPKTWPLVVALAVVVATIAGIGDWVARSRRPVTSFTRWSKLSPRRLPQTHVWTYVIFCVLLLSFCVRAYRLDFQPLDDDEYASTQAVIAITEHAVPRFVPEGVLYTRSPLFHYLGGGIAALCGANLWAMRLPSVLFGVGTCWLTYLCGARLLKSPWVGMGAMILMAFHPLEVYTSHVIRFYQMQQFMALLTLYFFCKGFVSGQSQVYRYLTVVAFLATVLCQELSCVMGFPLLLGYLVFARDKGASDNIKLVIVSACALAIICLDYAVFQSRCMTRLAGISPNFESTIKPHFWHPYNFLAIFICYSRLHVLPSFFLLLGLPLVCWGRKRNAMAFYLMLFSGVAMTNLLVTHISLRYQYWMIPIWALMSLEGMRALLKRACALDFQLPGERRRHGSLVAVSSTVLFIGIILSWSPWRMVGSYETKLVGDSTGAMQFVRRNLRRGDVVMVTEPHTHAAYLETGRVDYDLSVPLLYDYTMLQDGKLIDRNGGAEVVGSLGKLMDVCRQHSRVWIAVNREKLRNRGKHIRWEYPGGRVDLFLRRNCQLKHQTYLWSVYLWDANTGWYVPFREDRL